MTDGSLASGKAALHSGRWDDAVAAFRVALAEQETAEALEGMGRALWWLCDVRGSIRYRERAYVEFRHAGNAARACMAAIYTSVSYLVNLGNAAAARGWLARAERVMTDVDPNPMQGWLWAMQSVFTGDADRSRALLEQAIEFARRSGDLDLELLAVADLGLALVVGGRVDEGLALLDEAMAGTLGGEYTQPETLAFTSCNMLGACSLTGDLQRATQWCRVADEFMRDYGCPFLFAHCRAYYGGVLVARGQWLKAEEELQAALRMSLDAGPEAHRHAVVRLTELRCRQGRLEEVEALLADFDDILSAALPAARVRLARGQPEAAVALLGRRLEQIGEAHVEAAAALAMLVDAHLAAGDPDTAARTAARLDALAGDQDRLHTRALAALASAHLSGARGDTDESLAHLEGAWQLFSALDLPYESARVRLESATALAEGRPELAVAEARSALATFEELGAAADADAAASLLRSLGATGRTRPGHGGVLTRREQEVLQLLGLGLSNPEIAQRLFISRKTAAHHVSNVLAKLGMRNRAEAAAYASRSGNDARPVGRW
ncbi:MAG: LuxR C-terminal-related transcriptional regulator [Actinomycetota bacterium]